MPACLTIVLSLLSACAPANHKHIASHPVAPPLPDLARYVDPFIGTIGDGNTWPGATLPFGMVQWSPDTSAGGLSRPGGYNHGDLIMRGFSLTHLSGAGCVALGNILFMPTVRAATAPPQPNGSPYSDRFARASERASPGYYALRLTSGIGVQLAVTARSGLGAFTLPHGQGAMVVDAGAGAGGHGNMDGADASAVHINGRDEVTGWARGGHFCNLGNRYTVYFAARFDRPFAGISAWSGGRLTPGARMGKGRRAGAVVRFVGAPVVHVKVGLSYVSVAGARRNLEAESSSWSVDAARVAARAEWNRRLGAIQVTGGTVAARRTFYTALYHALLAPNVFSDVDGRYIGFDGRIHIAQHRTQYANFSGWDIYRTQIPLVAWLAPRETGDMMQSLVADAQQGGRLPKWPVANGYTGEMDGDSADPILAGARAFGARNFDAHAALQEMVTGATTPGGTGAGYQERPQVEQYDRSGYASTVPGGWGGAAETLEYATDDFAIAQLAHAVGDTRTYRDFLARSHRWRQLYNPATGYVEARGTDGLFPSVFSPASTDGFVEGNAAQYTWMVPHDLAWLARQVGGNRVAVQRLDRLFARLNAGPLAPFAWMGNEPSLGLPWEYDFLGRPDRTQRVVRRIMTSLYHDAPDGLPGNDDLGTMSAWYVWAALGLYPEIPSVGGLALGSPLFPHVRVVHTGGTLAIDAPNAAPAHPYVRNATLDGQSYHSTWLPLSALTGTRTLHLTVAP